MKTQAFGAGAMAMLVGSAIFLGAFFAAIGAPPDATSHDHAVFSLALGAVVTIAGAIVGSFDS